MVIYHCITYYHILKSCVHKLRFHEEESAIILVPENLQRKCSGLLNDKKNQKIFDQVFFHNWGASPLGGSKSAKVGEISIQMEAWLGEGYLDRVDEINICSAAYYFGIWAVEKKLQFNWFEEADGMLSQPHFLRDADKEVDSIRYEMAEVCGNYTGDNPFVKKKYIKFSAQTEGFYDPLAVDFDVVKEMQQLSTLDQKRMLSFFDVPSDLEFAKNSVLMLTQHFTNMRMLSYEEQAQIYQQTIDYCLDGYNLYVKWHPTDIMDYGNVLKNATMISGNFPTELLVLVAKEKLEVCGSIESSGTRNLAPICKKILLFNREYITNTYRLNHLYYFCLKLLECISDYHVCALGINRCHFENMLEFSDVQVNPKLTYMTSFHEKTNGQSPSIYLISKCESSVEERIKFFSECSEKDVLVFLNGYNENYFFPIKDEIPYLVKEIHIRHLEPQKFGNDADTERIFIFSKNQVIMEQIKKMKYTKELMQTGIETAVFESTDKDVQIAALKGMLNAVEIQLQRYAQENAELRDKLGEIN